MPIEQISESFSTYWDKLRTEVEKTNEFYINAFQLAQLCTV